MLPLCYASFVCLGVVLVLLGANQADLARDLDLDLAHSGLLASGFALGLGAGLVAAGPLVDRRSRRPIFALAVLLAGAALLLVDPRAGFAGMFALVTLFGLGLGIYDTFANAVVAERYREHAARPMALLHAAATVGAMLGPPLAGWLAAHAHWTASFRCVGVAHLALLGGALFVRFPAPPPRGPERAAEERVLSRALLPFAAMAFAYVGVEAALTLFAVPYAALALSLPEDRGRYAISALWLGIFAGRVALLAPRVVLGPGVVTLSGLLGAGVLLVGVASGWAQVELLFAAVGFALGSVYPLLIALASLRFPHARGTAAGLAAGAGALGGFCVPWLTGAIGDAAGVRLAIASLGAWSLAIALAAAAAGRAPLRSGSAPR